MVDMDLIYHEKQDGLLCGQHCLNNLLQGQYFTAVDLADIAQQMDQEEQRHMAELGMHTEDFKKFMEQPSVNMDDSGMFSVQVLSSALKVWDMTLVNYASSNPLALASRRNPVDQQAYICNFKEHWFTVRKLGIQWFNLNSLLTYPELISNTYLSLFLTQLQHEGYCIFVVDGKLPPTPADEVLKIQLAVQDIKPKLLAEVTESSVKKEELELRAALEASLAHALSAGLTTVNHERSSTVTDNPSSSNIRSEDDDLQAAIRLSLQLSEDDDKEINRRLELSQNTPEELIEEPDICKLREKRLSYLTKSDKKP